ncbi:MAG: LytTR family DNA-binding domain-containing protein [Flavitalea sp.]
MLRAIAIDDEPIALQIIKKFCDQVSFIELAGTFTNAFEAVEYIRNSRVDLLFLDIKMPDISGMEVLKMLSDPPMTIFTTAYSEHAVQSFELNAIDYLLKPFSFERFAKACGKVKELYDLREKAADVQKGEPDHIFLRSGYEQIRINLSDIRIIQSAGNYVQFILDSERHMSRLTMSEVEKLLPADSFVRIHRSYIISKQFITRFDKTSITIGEKILPVGGGYKLPFL